MSDLITDTVSSIFDTLDETVSKNSRPILNKSVKAFTEPKQIEESIDLDRIILDLETDLEHSTDAIIEQPVETQVVEVPIVNTAPILDLGKSKKEEPIINKEQSGITETVIDKIIHELQVDLGESVEEDIVTEDVITEDYIEPIEEPTLPTVVNSMMDDLSDKLSTYVNRTNTKYVEPDPQDLSVIVENLSKQIQDVRRLVLENTIVSGIGQGGDGQTPGSGEVWFYRLDDVNMDGLEDGDTIIWDQESGKWVPGKPEPDVLCGIDVSGGPVNPTNTFDEELSGSDIIGYYPDGYTDGGDSTDACSVIIT